MQCRSVTAEELKARYKEDVQRITDVMSVEQSTAVAIMRHYEWYEPLFRLDKLRNSCSEEYSD